MRCSRGHASSDLSAGWHPLHWHPPLTGAMSDGDIGAAVGLSLVHVLQPQPGRVTHEPYRPEDPVET